MPYDATGKWITEDASVAPRVTSLIATNNPLIQQARANGLAAGNRRGLLNSTMAAGAGEAEAYKVALPIASQEAQQIQQSNLAAQNNTAAAGLQSSDIAAQMDRLRTQAGFTSSLQGESDAAQMARLQASGTISGQQQAAALAAQAEQQRVAGTQSLANIQAQGQVQGTLNAADAQAQMARLQASLAGASDQQRAQITAQMDQLRTQIAGQSSLATQQGQIQASLADQNNAAEYARLQASLSQATASQQTDIRAQMDRLQASSQANLAQLAAQAGYQTQQIAQQGGIQASLQDQNNAAEYSRLQASLAQATSAQQVDIRAQMDRLQAGSTADLAKLAAQNVYTQQQTAQQFGLQGQLATLQGSIQSALQAQGADQAKALETVKGTIQSALQSQANDQQLQRMAADYAQQTKIQASDQQAAMARLQTSGDQQLAQLAAQQQGELQKLSMSLAQQDRQNVAASVVTIFQQEANMRAALLANTAMPAAERSAYEAAIATLGNPARQFISQLYGSPATAPAAPGTTGLNAGGALGNGSTYTPEPVGTPMPITNPAGGSAAGPTAGGGLNAGGALGNPNDFSNYSNYQPIQLPSPYLSPIQPSAGIAAPDQLSALLAQQQDALFRGQLGNVRQIQ